MWKVAVIECTTYDKADVKEKLLQVPQLLGFDWSGLAAGKSVLLKPNLLMGAEPEQAVTTHPAVTEALAEIIREASLNVLVGDSPGYGNSMLEVREKTGYGALCDRLSIPLVDLGETESYLFDTGERAGELPISKLVKTCSVISVPKVKTSRGVLLTCGVKNVFGCVCGFHKEKLHSRSDSAAAFYNTLIRICQEVQPALTIADGIVMMEGEGPDQGKARPLHLLFASFHPFALDWVVSLSLGLNPEAVGTLHFSGESRDDYARIEITGLDPARFPMLAPELPRLISARQLNWCPIRI